MKNLRLGKRVHVQMTIHPALKPSEAIQHLRDLGVEGNLQERLRSMAARNEVEARYQAVKIAVHGKIDPSFWETSMDREFDWTCATFGAVVEDAPIIGGLPWRLTYEGVRFTFDHDLQEMPIVEDEDEDQLARQRGRPRDEKRWELVTGALLALSAAGRLDPKSPEFILSRTDLVNEIRRSPIWRRNNSEPPSAKTLRPAIDRLCLLAGITMK